MNTPRETYDMNYMEPTFERDDIPFRGCCFAAPIDVEVQQSDGTLPIVVVIKYRNEPDITQIYRSTYEGVVSWEAILVEAIAIAEVACARADIVWQAFGSEEEHHGAFSIMLRHLGFKLVGA